MRVVVERLGYDLAALLRIDVPVGVYGSDGDVRTGIPRLVIVEMVHDEIAVLLVHEPERHRLYVFVVVAGGKGILPLVVYTVHWGFHPVLYGVDLPAAVGVEHVCHQYALAVWQGPVFAIRFAVVFAVRHKECHLLALLPKRALVVTVSKVRAVEGIDIVAVRGSAYIDVRLPYIAARRGVAMLHNVFALELNLVVDGKMRMSAKEFVAALELFQQGEYRGQSGGGIVSAFVLHAERLGFAEGRSAEGKGDMIA